MKRKITVLTIFALLSASAVAQVAEALPSNYNNLQGAMRKMQYTPSGNAFSCENGTNRFTRALYGGFTDYRVETSDRPVFAIAKKGQYKSIRFVVEGVALDSAEYCWARYENGMRSYVLKDSRWKRYGTGIVRVHVVAMHKEEGVIFRFIGDKWSVPLRVNVRICDIANTEMKRNGDLGVDAPGVFEPAPGERGLVTGLASSIRNFGHLIIKGDEIAPIGDITASQMFTEAYKYYQNLASRIEFSTPDPYINTLGGALVMAAEGDWDGQTWLHGCVGWRIPLPGWRAAYMGDVLGWNDRAVKHFDAYAKSQVTEVEPTIPHPSQDAGMNLARAEKKWGTQMYSNGYICRNPEQKDQLHHYDMNLSYIDELLWHFQYNADVDYMKKMWPVIKSHLAWEKRNYDPDGDHLYDAYCCIWASDALYYSGGAVTHSSAYNYRANKLAARIAELIGEDGKPYADEAEAILSAMNERLWLQERGHWAEFQEAQGLKRLHESAAVWSIYTPVDCGAGSDEQFFRAMQYVDSDIPHIDIEEKGYQTIATSNWLPYSWSINNVAPAEVMHTALAYFQAGRPETGFRLLKANVLDNMYYGQSPANFGQLSHYDAARGECYRDFGDCIGISSRALLQGLFGIVPNALYGQCIIRPGFPFTWNKASVKTPYIEYKFTRKNGKDRFEITQNFAQPLKMIVRQNLGNGNYRDVEGNSDRHQVIEVDTEGPFDEISKMKIETTPPAAYGLEEPETSGKFKPQDIDSYLNAEVTDIFKNRYVSPRPQTTTLQIPVQGVGEWCHPDYKPNIDDTQFRSLISGDKFTVAGVPFRTLKQGKNIVYTSLWDNYPNEVEIPLKGKAANAYLLMAGSTNHMQCHIDNGIVIVEYKDGSTETLPLRTPLNWCPIERDYYIDGKAFCTLETRPYRVCLGTGTVSRDLGKELNIKGVDGREIPGGAAQMLRMSLNPKKKLKSLTVRTLSNDVVIGLMAVTLQ